MTREEILKRSSLVYELKRIEEELEHLKSCFGLHLFSTASGRDIQIGNDDNNYRVGSCSNTEHPELFKLILPVIKPIMAVWYKEKINALKKEIGLEED